MKDISSKNKISPSISNEKSSQIKSNHTSKQSKSSHPTQSHSRSFASGSEKTVYMTSGDNSSREYSSSYEAPTHDESSFERFMNKNPKARRNAYAEPAYSDMSNQSGNNSYIKNKIKDPAESRPTKKTKVNPRRQVPFLKLEKGEEVTSLYRLPEVSPEEQKELEQTIKHANEETHEETAEYAPEIQNSKKNKQSTSSSSSKQDKALLHDFTDEELRQLDKAFENIEDILESIESRESADKKKDI